jgi:hypothetical protein
VGSLETDGWTLVSAEARHAAHPTTFQIPSLEARASLRPGDAAKLLFEIETRENGQVIDRGIDRMWVIVRCQAGNSYRGVLDNDPGRARGLKLRAGDEIAFGPEHVAEIATPPRPYVLEKYGPGFLGE